MAVRVGVIGLGNMGIPMAHRISAQFDVVGYDASPDARDNAVAAGLTLAASVAELGRTCEAVILLLPDSNIVEQVVLDDGLSRSMREGSVLVDMSSSDPVRTRTLAAVIADAGVHLVDAPVSGGVKGARAGTLTIMAGGDAADVARVEPLLVTMGTVIRTGAVGSGHAVKALNNMLSAISMLATGEAMEVGRAFGLTDDVLLAVFNTSSGRSFSTEYKWPTFVVTETFNSGFAARLLAKDLRIATELAARMERPTRLGTCALPEWDAAVGVLGSGADHTELARYLESRD